MNGAKKTRSKAAKKLWGYTKRRELRDFINGNYEEAVKLFEGKEDIESKLLLAESHAALNHYDTAKSLYEELVEGNDKTIAGLAENELQQMNRKFFLYGYTHFFDGKISEAKKEFEFLKSNITPKDEVAEKTSLLLMYAYGNEKNLPQMLQEAEYFIKTFPKSEFAEPIRENLKQMKEDIKKQMEQEQTPGQN